MLLGRPRVLRIALVKLLLQLRYCVFQLGNPGIVRCGHLWRLGQDQQPLADSLKLLGAVLHVGANLGRFVREKVGGQFPRRRLTQPVEGWRRERSLNAG